jgi:hypothetical protein
MTPLLVLTAIIFLVFLGIVLWVYDRREKICPYCGKQGHVTGVETGEKRPETKHHVGRAPSLVMVRTIFRSYRCMSCDRTWQKTFEEEGKYDPTEDPYSYDD